MDFWNVVALICWSFLFFAYLLVLFQILGDLFRDRTIGGFAKAVWVIALIFIPFLSALIYLVARGRGMAERQAEQIAELQQSQAEYIRQVSGSGGGAADQIARAKELLDAGAISQAEFDKLKAQALA